MNLPAPFSHMQAALDLAPTSPHPINKIAATLFGTDESGAEFSISRTNHWPEIIEKHFGTEIDVGNSSGTIHAETDCLANCGHATEGASICITDPFCPNCAKNMAEAGIKNIYIDQGGFDKDFFKRRGGHFDTMSMQICEKAGINVYALNVATQETTPILEIADDYVPVEDSPVEKQKINQATDDVFTSVITTAKEKHYNRKFAIALAEDNDGNKFSLTARAHAVVGYTLCEPEEALSLMTPIGKYSFIQEPINRLMMNLRRKGLTLLNGYLFCSQVPTSREQVNLAGAGVQTLHIGDIEQCRDKYGFQAMKKLQSAKIIAYHPFE